MTISKSKKTILFISAFIFLLAITSKNLASALYNPSEWYMSEGWVGEIPNGFSIVNDGVELVGREAMDRAVPAVLGCPVPKNAVYHPFNSEREARYVTMSKIIPLKVATATSFMVQPAREGDPEVELDLRVNDVVEYLALGDEGGFFGRYQGKEYFFSSDFIPFIDEASQNFLADSDSEENIDEWVEIPCTNGKKAWILYSELMASGIEGVGNWENGEYEDRDNDGSTITLVGDIID